MMKGFVFGLLVVLFLSGCSTVELQQPVTTFPVVEGQVGPVSDDNSLQYPFSCNTAEAGMGNPVVDNQEGKGQPVFERWLFFDYKQGYSLYCGAPMNVSYWYRTTAGEFKPLRSSDTLPEEVELFNYQGQEIPFVVRYERGVINRFLYGVTVLSQWPLETVQPISKLWNSKLLMLFNGGIGIGHHQSGVVSMGMLGPGAPNSKDLISIFNPDLLKRGYVIAGSSGMGTDTSFNLPLLQQTAEMVKQQVVAEFGEPEYTLGFGGSGGSIQQFYNGRQSPDLLDASIVSHMFPDLLSQINGVGDCELLNYYFDRNHADSGLPAEYWNSWQNRGRIEGFNALNGFKTQRSIDQSGVPIMSKAVPGSSVCVEGWRGITPLIFNPKFYLPFYDMHVGWLKHDSHILDNTAWSHWDDAKQIYGVDGNGFALRTFDNVGVQYGLEALLQGHLSVDAFIDLNAKVGGWKQPSEMQYEYAPFYPYGSLVLGNQVSVGDFVLGNIKLRGFGDFWHGTQNLITLLPDNKVPPKIKKWLGESDQQSVWSEHNSTTSMGLEVSPRAYAAPEAIQRAKERGMVFDGHWTKPTIALLVYLDDLLDIHDARQPFIFRERMKKVQSDIDNFNIWGLKPSGNEDKDKVQLSKIAMLSVDVMDRWLSQQVKPADAEDRCWNEQYQLVDQGKKTWSESGDLQGESKCQALFPMHGNPRTAAGGPFTSEILKCRLKPLQAALQDGTYGNVVFSDQQISKLETIFPEGVCSYH